MRGSPAERDPSPQPRRRVVCVVCGQRFPNKIDLEKHSNDDKHVFSLKPSRNFPCGCAVCGYFFTDAHKLDMHSTTSECRLEQAESVSSSTTSAIHEQDSSKESPRRVDSLNRSLECNVCGKVFPKGVGDVVRHTTAITLQHLWSDKKDSTYSFGCESCGVYFASQEHLDLHLTSTYIHTQGAMTTRRKKRDRSAMSTPSAAKTTTVRSSFATPSVEIASRQLPSEIKQETVRSSIKPKSISDNVASSVSRNKRAKMIIPEERKAFFSIVSALIDPAEVDSAIKLTDENYESFLAAEHLPLVQRLKSVLLCSAV